MPKVSLLDNGYVQLVKCAGSEADIGRIASISRAQHEPSREDCERIFAGLLSRGEESPLEFAFLIFRVRCPIFVARQWMRHRIGSFSERSLRHVEPEDAYVPENTDAELIGSVYEAIWSVYRALREEGMRKEAARVVLPLGTYTEFYWGVNLRSLMNFLRQRLRKTAQIEMRVYAAAVALLARQCYPTAVARLQIELKDEWPSGTIQKMEVQ